MMKINQKSLYIVAGLGLVTVGLCGIWGIYVGAISLGVMILAVAANS